MGFTKLSCERVKFNSGNGTTARLIGSSLAATISKTEANTLAISSSAVIGMIIPKSDCNLEIIAKA